jgi:hydrocephalus-inducing protein
MSTLLNPYEITRIAVVGEAFFEEIVFEKLPNDLEDEVIFGDSVIGSEKKITFMIRNNGSNIVRF